MSDPVRSLAFDELEVGQRATLLRTVMAHDLTRFAEVSGDGNPVHLSDHFAAKTRFGQLAAAGLTATIFFYVSINLMMVMGLAPVVGIPLPLVSFGGSAVMTVMICLGILMSFERQSRTRATLS